MIQITKLSKPAAPCQERLPLMQQDCYIIANSLIDAELITLLPRATISNDNYFVIVK